RGREPGHPLDTGGAARRGIHRGSAGLRPPGLGRGTADPALRGFPGRLQPDVRALPAGGVTEGRVLTMAEAVERFVPDGAMVAMGTALEPAIPFAAGHEMIRQGRRDLTLVGPISDALFDQLIGAGCVARVCAAWVGNVSEGLGHCY